MSIELKGLLWALAASFGVPGGTFAVSLLWQTTRAADANQARPTNAIAMIRTEIPESAAKHGQALFEHNCAPCHGDDARGDEGPNLHNLDLSDARIATIIRAGIKGEMPSFAKKFSDLDVQALIAYLRTLKDR